MIIHDLVQGSDKWKLWRNGGIGSSDVAIIAGHNPYKSVFKLWEEKVSGESSFQGNKHTEYGQKMEPIARALYEDKHGIKLTPCCASHPNVSWALGSFDGRNSRAMHSIEIKSHTSKKKLVQAKKGLVQKIYYAQLQWLMFISGDDHIDYVTTLNENEISERLVLRDHRFIDDLLALAAAFWDAVQRKEMINHWPEALAVPEFCI